MHIKPTSTRVKKEMKMGKLDYLDNTYCTEKLINSTCLQRHNQLNLY